MAAKKDPGGFSKKGAAKQIKSSQQREIAKGERAAAKSKGSQSGWFTRGKGKR